MRYDLFMSAAEHHRSPWRLTMQLIFTPMILRIVERRKAELVVLLRHGPHADGDQWMKCSGAQAKSQPSICTR